MPPRILLLGGHGKVSLLLTPKLVSRSWNLTSVIRNPDQKTAILEAGKNGPGKIDVLVASIEDVKSDADAKKILDQVRPDWVVWSAGMSAVLLSISFLRVPILQFKTKCGIRRIGTDYPNRCRRQRRTRPY